MIESLRRIHQESLRELTIVHEEEDQDEGENPERKEFPLIVLLNTLMRIPLKISLILTKKISVNFKRELKHV